MKTQEIKELTIQELEERLQGARKDYDEKRMAHAVSPLDNPAELRMARRDIARMETLLRARRSIAQTDK